MKKLIKSAKGCDLLVVDDFIFRIEKKGQNKVYWRCRVKTCRARGSTVLHYSEFLDSFDLIRGHNHVIDSVEVEKKIHVEEMKLLAEDSGSSVRSIVGLVLRGKSAATIKNTGKFENLSRIVRYHRNLHINPKPYIYPSLKLGVNLSSTHTASKFYQYGVDNYRNLSENSNFLIFYSEAMVSNMKSEKVWCVDGTFCVVPKPYFQLFTVSFLRQVHVFPVFFCILKNKKETTYYELLSTILLLCGSFTPKYIKVDFELASINALKATFPDAEISSCSFHLGQCLQRHLKFCGLFNIYKQNTVVKKYVKALTALSFVEISRISETYENLLASSDFPSVLMPIYEYFYNTFISSNTSSFGLSIWHSITLTLENIPKTNNAIEAWHNVFNSTFGTSKFNFHLLILKLKDEEEIIRQKYIRICSGEILVRKKKYIEMESNLKMFILNYRERYGIEYVFQLVNLLYY